MIELRNLQCKTEIKLKLGLFWGEKRNLGPKSGDRAKKLGV